MVISSALRSLPSSWIDFFTKILFGQQGDVTEIFTRYNIDTVISTSMYISSSSSHTHLGALLYFYYYYYFYLFSSQFSSLLINWTQLKTRFFYIFFFSLHAAANFSFSRVFHELYFFLLRWLLLSSYHHRRHVCMCRQSSQYNNLFHMKSHE
jgi:hypothetical protein